VGGTVTALAWSADGHWLAVGAAGRRLLVFAVADGKLVAAFGTNAGILALWWTPEGNEIWAADNGAGLGYPRVYKLQREGSW
jgi:hypothetical protein